MTGIDLNTVEEDEEEAAEEVAANGSSPAPARAGAVCLELWHACAGPVAPLPRKGGVVVYLPQGHLEHLGDAPAAAAAAAAVPPHVFCRVVDVTLLVRPFSMLVSYVFSSSRRREGIDWLCVLLCRRTRRPTRCTRSSRLSRRRRCAPACAKQLEHLV
jgi:hypothetical protein